MRSFCPFCGAESWQELGAEATGEVMGKLAKVSQKYSAEKQAAQRAIQEAVGARDREALRAAVERASDSELRAYEESGYFEVMGLRSEADILAFKEQQVSAQLDVWLAQMGEPPTPASSATFQSGGGNAGGGFQSAVEASKAAQAIEFTYHEALMNRDLDGLVTRFKREMTAMYRQGGGLAEGEIEGMVHGALEQLLRDQPWVSKEDLRRLGIKTTYDAERGDGSIAVDCQQCGVPMQAPDGAESVQCAYCGAITRLHLRGDARQAAIERGMKRGGFEL